MAALVHQLLAQLAAWHDSIQQFGWLGILGYAAAMVALQMVLIPLALFGVAAGVLFGFWKGVACVTIATNAGAAINFLIARHVARGAVNRYLAHHEKFRLIDAAIGREGGKIVALLRFCPLPFGLANYSYGLTSVGFRSYMLATVLCTIPGNCFFVWLGASTSVGLEAMAGVGRPRHPGEYVLMVVGLVAAFCALTYITKVAKAAVARGEPPPAGPAAIS